MIKQLCDSRTNKRNDFEIYQKFHKYVDVDIMWNLCKSKP